MVCTLGKGRMSTMARLLGNGSYSEMTEEEVSHEKLAAQCIRRELLEADEPNLLEEEDMHIFDCKPLVDPLHLVCCNNCKKPVKASQFAAHAECCRSLNHSEVVLLELDGGTGRKKPPRKGRKKSQAAHRNPTITVRGHGNFGSMGGEDTAALDSVDEQIGEPKRNSAFIGAASVKDCPLLCSGSTKHTAVVMSPSEKRTKLIAAKHLVISEGPETATGVISNYGVHYQMASTYPPAPLATKMYHSQKNLRLRNALNHLYHETSTNDHCSESSKLVQETVMLPSQLSSFRDLPYDLQAVQDFQEKNDACSSGALQVPDQTLVNSSELCSGNSRGCTSAMEFSDQFRDNLSRSSLSVDTAAVGKMRSRYLSTAYSYAGNSGTSLGNMQQPSGSVHVV